MHHAGQSLEYIDPTSGKRLIPHVIEPAAGINRLFLTMLFDGYWEDVERSRIVLKLKPALAPYKVAVFPLVRNKPELVQVARNLFEAVLDEMPAVWDSRGNIGKRYLAQDEIGTPFCVTVDYQTLEDQTVTVRNRDDARQERVNAANLLAYVQEKVRR
jgi:glycyl-tRNA synthetase